MNRKLLVPLAIVAVLAVAGWAWLSQRKSSSPDELTLYGNVDIRQVSLAFNASERIASLAVREGDRVHAGDVLGTLDLRTARLRLAQSEAQQGAQQQVLQRLQAGSRKEEIAQARANLAAADADAQLAAREAARLQATSDATGGRAVSPQDLDAALARRSETQARADSAREAAALVIAGPRREDIAQADRQLEVTRAEQALIQRQIDESALRAPVDAVVRARLLEPGDMASPQRPVFTLAITQPKWVRAYAPESQLSRLRTGMNATVTTDAEPEHRIPAKLDYIASVAEFTPKTVQTTELRTSLVYELRFTVEDPNDTLRLGMPATVHLPLTGAGADAAAPR